MKRTIRLHRRLHSHTEWTHFYSSFFFFEKYNTFFFIQTKMWTAVSHKHVCVQLLFLFFSFFFYKRSPQTCFETLWMNLKISQKVWSIRDVEWNLTDGSKTSDRRALREAATPRERIKRRSSSGPIGFLSAEEKKTQNVENKVRPKKKSWAF